MTPDLPTRLRREAARWGDSKLAELLTQAADQMEAVIEALNHHREANVKLGYGQTGWPQVLTLQAQLAASRALLDTVRDYLTREAHPDWTDAARVSMAHAALTGPAATP